METRDSDLRCLGGRWCPSEVIRASVEYLALRLTFELRVAVGKAGL